MNFVAGLGVVLIVAWVALMVVALVESWRDDH